MGCYGCGISMLVIGVILAGGGGYVFFGFVPGFIDRAILNEVVLYNDTVQMDRFLEVPFPLPMKLHIFNITNPDEVLQGAIPVVQELGPYVYDQIFTRQVELYEEDSLDWREFSTYEFNVEASYPFHEDDILTVVNAPYNAILQVAEATLPTLLPLLIPFLNQVFGAENNSPIMQVSVKDMLFDGIYMCENPSILGAIACSQVRERAQESENMKMYDDGSFSFSFLDYKRQDNRSLFRTNRGVRDFTKLGNLELFENANRLSYWPDGDQELSRCNMINGSDSTIFPPFVNRDEYLWAYNVDICRSIRLQYEYDHEMYGIPVARFTPGTTMFSDEEGCFCLNMTEGIRQENGCLYPGGLEMFTCFGAFLVVTHPHFLYAHPIYQNGVVGVTPDVEKHQVFIDIEPRTGYPINGARRAQFNMFLRPVANVAATQPLRTTLVPLLWVEESVELPDDLVDEVHRMMLLPLAIVSVLQWVVVALGVLMTFAGVYLAVKYKPSRNQVPQITIAKDDK